MLRCLVAAGSNALRRAAMRPRGDGAPIRCVSNRARYRYAATCMLFMRQAATRANARPRFGQRSSGLDHALVEVGWPAAEADLRQSHASLGNDGRNATSASDVNGRIPCPSPFGWPFWPGRTWITSVVRGAIAYPL